jgi:hypothetical protein
MVVCNAGFAWLSVTRMLQEQLAFVVSSQRHFGDAERDLRLHLMWDFSKSATKEEEFAPSLTRHFL